MKTTTVISLFIIILSINACSKGCPEGDKPFDKGVDKSYLPYIIPYSDTSTRLFLKNGKDTLLFKSQGLKETFIIETLPSVCEKYKLQQYSLKMAASDTDFFRINYYAEKSGVLYNDYEIFSGNHYSKSETYSTNAYINNFSTIESITVLNHNYDSINTAINSSHDVFISRPKTGVLKIKTANVLYELIN